MINPDNFIFHSDFYYPSGFLHGTKEYRGISTPANLELSDKYNDGDYYSAYVEVGNVIGETFVGVTMYTYTSGNKLMVRIGAQGAGSKFSGKIHWRIYPRSKTFNFLSSGKLEQTAKSLNGYITLKKAISETDIDIPSGVSGKYILRGTWQIEGRGANLLDLAGENSTKMSAWYNTATNRINGQFFSARPLPVGTKVYYKIQLVPVTPQDIFIFNSQKYSFALPKIVEKTITNSATIGADTAANFYGEWVDIPGSKTAYDLIVKWDKEPHKTHQHYQDAVLVPNRVTAVATLESDGNRVRPRLRVSNGSLSPVSYPKQTFTYGIYFYQNNNTT